MKKKKKLYREIQTYTGMPSKTVGVLATYAVDVYFIHPRDSIKTS